MKAEAVWAACAASMPVLFMLASNRLTSATTVVFGRVMTSRMQVSKKDAASADHLHLLTAAVAALMARVPDAQVVASSAAGKPLSASPSLAPREVSRLTSARCRRGMRRRSVQFREGLGPGLWSPEAPVALLCGLGAAAWLGPQ
jgi:hypothetical protein